MTTATANDRPASDLGRAIRAQGPTGYALFRAPWQTAGLSLWIRYREDGEIRATLAMDDLPETARDDFDYHVAQIEAEIRAEMISEGLEPSPAPRNALDLCNACDLEDAHDGCEAGYCSTCCPAHDLGDAALEAETSLTEAEAEAFADEVLSRVSRATPKDPDEALLFAVASAALEHGSPVRITRWVGQARGVAVSREIVTVTDVTRYRLHTADGRGWTSSIPWASVATIAVATNPSAL